MAEPGRKLTYADLQVTPDDGKRYELVRGSLLVTPSPSPQHQRIRAALSKRAGSARCSLHRRTSSSPTRTCSFRICWSLRIRATSPPAGSKGHRSWSLRSCPPPPARRIGGSSPTATPSLGSPTTGSWIPIGSASSAPPVGRRVPSSRRRRGGRTPRPSGLERSDRGPRRALALTPADPVTFLETIRRARPGISPWFARPTHDRAASAGRDGELSRKPLSRPRRRPVGCRSLPSSSW